MQEVALNQSTCTLVCTKMNLSTSEPLECNGTRQARRVAKGEWLYDGTVTMPVQIYAINYDYYFDMDEGYLEEGEEPQLNRHGEMYMLAWHDDKYFSFAGPVACGGLTLNNARAAAEEATQQEIKWTVITKGD